MIKTTVIGSFPKPIYLTVPNWFDNHSFKSSYSPDKYTKYLQIFNEGKTISLLKGIKEIISKQENIGIDILTDGELKRENFIFYMLRYVNGINFLKTKIKKIRGCALDIYSPTITSKIKLNRHVLSNDFEIAKLFTNNDIKITIPGPFTILDYLNNEYYKSNENLLNDICNLINCEIIQLVKKGCKYIQLDETSFIYNYNNIEDKIDYINNCFKNVPEDIKKIIHISRGYPKKLDKKFYINKNFDAYRVLLPVLDDSDIDQISIEGDFGEDNFEILDLIKKKDLILGVINIGSTVVETVYQIKIKIFKALEYIDPDKLIISPNGGMGMLPDEVCFKKLENMVYAVNHANIILNLK